MRRLERGQRRAAVNQSLSRAGSTEDKSGQTFASVRRPEPLLQNSTIMKWTATYLVGFIIVLGGVLAALWKTGTLERIGATWTIIGVVIAVGLGIMIAVANSGRKETIHIDK